MASPQPMENRKVKERVRGYKANVISELLEEGEQLRASLASTFNDPTAYGLLPPLNGTARSGSRMGFSGRGLDGSLEEPANNLEERRLAQRAKKQAEIDVKHKEFKEMTQRRTMEAVKKKDAQFQRDYEEVLGGLSNSTGIMGDTRYTVEHKEKANIVKAVALHKEWTEQVFDVVQERLQGAVDERSHKEVEGRLRTQMDQYLTISNGKQGVFRDVIIEADYDPLSALDASIRIPVGDIVDPLKRDVLKPQHERQLMGLPADTGPLGKTTFDTKLWGALLIGSTPYGHCIDKNGEYTTGTMTQLGLEARTSHVVMDHYTYARGDEAVAAELPKGKRVLPNEEAKQGRHGLFDVVQHTCGDHPETTGGDRWMEAKGKGMVAPPVGRTNAAFSDVVQQQIGDPYVKPRPVMGDSWLDAKGKVKLPGPEILRGRPDLFAVVQQTGRPAVASPPPPPGATGDLWLEAKGKRGHVAPNNDLGRTVLTSVPQPLDVIRQRDPRMYMSHVVPLGGGMSCTE